MQPVARSKQFTWAVLGSKCGSRNGASWVAREPARWQGSDASLTLERGQIGLAHTLNVECEGRAFPDEEGKAGGHRSLSQQY